MYTIEMLNGTFDYLSANNLANAFTFRNQGYGELVPHECVRWDLPSGDFTHAGITSIDESDDGKVTFDWIHEQMQSCEAVVLAFSLGEAQDCPLWGHAVRVECCGEVYGLPYLIVGHDNPQTQYLDEDTGIWVGDDVGCQYTLFILGDNDKEGYLDPLIGDSYFGEINFALSISPKDIIIPKIKVVKPMPKLYVFDREFISLAMPFVIGSLTIEVTANDGELAIDRVDFYIDDEHMFSDYIAPYAWKW